ARQAIEQEGRLGSLGLTATSRGSGLSQGPGRFAPLGARAQEPPGCLGPREVAVSCELFATRTRCPNRMAPILDRSPRELLAASNKNLPTQRGLAGQRSPRASCRGLRPASTVAF